MNLGQHIDKEKDNPNNLTKSIKMKRNEVEFTSSNKKSYYDSGMVPAPLESHSLHSTIGSQKNSYLKKEAGYINHSHKTDYHYN